MKPYKLAIVPGDGIGPEVVREGLKVLDVVSQKYGFKTERTNFDFGGRLEFEFGAIAVSFESVYRRVSSHPELNTSRNVGIVQYKLSGNLFLTGTFGKNFGDTDNLVSFLGLNWGFGKTALYNKLSYR